MSLTLHTCVLHLIIVLIDVHTARHLMHNRMWLPLKLADAIVSDH